LSNELVVANEPAEKDPLSVVVAPYETVLPIVNPRTVGVLVPMSAIVPPSVADVSVIADAALLVTVGGAPAYEPAPKFPEP
jgi:6-phosphogluconate dehydrogenase (decarboxylating)